MVIVNREQDLERGLVRRGWEFIDLLERVGGAKGRHQFAARWEAERARARDSFQPLILGNLCGSSYRRIYEGPSNLTRFRRTLDYVTAGERVFDIGLGKGYLPGIMLRDGRLDAYRGIDLEESNVAATRQLLELNGLAERGTVDLGDLYEVTQAEVAQFGADLVVCCEVIEHVPDPEQAVQALADALPPGADLLISVPLLGQLEAVWGHLNIFDAARARAMVENAGLTVHHVDPVDNVWTFVLASKSSGPSPRAARAEAALVDVTADAPMTPGLPRSFERINLADVGVEPSGWLKRLTSSHMAIVDGGVELDAVAKPDPDSSGHAAYAGIRLPLQSARGLRFELEVKAAERVKAIYVDFSADGTRVGRWKWDGSRVPIEPKRKTHVLRPGKPSVNFTTTNSGDLITATAVDVFAQLDHGGSVKLRLNRAAILI